MLIKAGDHVPGRRSGEQMSLGSQGGGGAPAPAAPTHEPLRCSPDPVWPAASSFLGLREPPPCQDLTQLHQFRVLTPTAECSDGRSQEPGAPLSGTPEGLAPALPPTSCWCPCPQHRQSENDQVYQGCASRTGLRGGMARPGPQELERLGLQNCFLLHPEP